MFRQIKEELKTHAPFTVLGAITGIVLMVFFRNLPYKTAENAFYVFHPLHVLLSGMATAAMYRRHKCSVDRRQCNIFVLLVIGYVGALGVATLSDSVIPYLGELLLNMPNRHMHAGFLEKPLLINFLAILGVMIAYFKPATKFPHFGHVLLSTWASVFHIIMAKGQVLPLFSYLVVFIFLFLAVWLPCCVSDIIFPLLFVTDDTDEHK